MIRFIRKRLTYANVAMTLALVFAMSGGAYAAKHYLITSTKQISPKVLKQLKGAAGPAGSVGPAGPQGPAGAAGKEGTAGKAGANGESVTVGKVELSEAACNKLGGSKFTVGGKEATACNGEKGAKGAQGEPWTAGGTLPSGKTETGTWGFQVYSKEGLAFGAYVGAPISYNIPLKEKPVEIVEVPFGNGTTVPGKCVGTIEMPTAEPGYLCVYTEFDGAGGVLAKEPAFENFTTSGAELLFHSTSSFSNGAFQFGTWAVTAK